MIGNPAPATPSPRVDLDALLCALVLAPRSFARNRFFSLYEEPAARKVRRRAARLRAIVRLLAGLGRDGAEITGEQVMFDGRVLLKYEVGSLALAHTLTLSALEAAALRFALHRSVGRALPAQDRATVEKALGGLGKGLGLEERA